jgi:arsenate reductase
MKLSEKLPAMNEAQMLELLASNGKLIKRPLLVSGNTVLVGFDEKKYAQNFK